MGSWELLLATAVKVGDLVALDGLAYCVIDVDTLGEIVFIQAGPRMETCGPGERVLTFLA